MPFILFITDTELEEGNKYGMTYSIKASNRMTLLALALHRWYVGIIVRCFLFLGTATLLLADPTATTSDAKDAKNLTPLLNPPTLRVSQDVSINYTYVGDADLKTSSGGRVGEQTTVFGYGARVPLNEQFGLILGLGYNRLDFGQPAGSPLPYNLQTLSVNIGVSYKLCEEWNLFGVVSPRLDLIDGWNQIESQDVGIGGAIGANYVANKDFSLRFGLAANPGSTGLPVMPLLGLRWQFAPEWSLNVGFPKTSIDFQVLPNLRVSPIELGYLGGSFHTSKTYGTSVGMVQLNDRKLEYHEVRLGAGADYAIQKNIHVNLDAGAVVYREFNFDDASFNPQVKPAPFVQLGVKVGF